MIPLLRRPGTCAKHLFKSYFDNTLQMRILSPQIPLLEAFLGDSPIPEEREERQRKPIPAVHFKSPVVSRRNQRWKIACTCKKKRFSVQPCAFMERMSCWCHLTIFLKPLINPLQKHIFKKYYFYCSLLPCSGKATSTLSGRHKRTAAPHLLTMNPSRHPFC